MRYAVPVLILCSLVGCQSAEARNYHEDIWGLGEQRCRDVYHEPESGTQVQTWIEGFLTASALLKGKPEYKKTPAGLAIVVEEACSKKPNARIFDILQDALR